MTVEESSSIRTFGTHRWVCYAWATAATAATAAVPLCSSSGTAGGFLRICLAAATGLCVLAAAKDISDQEAEEAESLKTFEADREGLADLEARKGHTYLLD